MAQLYFYYSAMNAGKSTTLLQSSHNYRERGMDTLIFAPQLDQRFEETVVHSRIGLQESALPYNKEFSFLNYVKEQRSEKLKCILIDEAQFLSKQQVAQLTQIASKLNIAVLAYGIRSDFLGEPFEGSQYLLAWADNIQEIKTVCTCGKKATMNLRIDGNGNPVHAGSQVLIGGNESYISLCMKHYQEKVPGFAQS